MLTKNKCNKLHIADRLAVEIAITVWLIGQSDHQYIPQQSLVLSRQLQARSIVYLLSTLRMTTSHLVEELAYLVFFSHFNKFRNLVVFLIYVVLKPTW